MNQPRRAGFDAQPVGLVGLGLMGRGIAACLLSHGLNVIAFDRSSRHTRNVGDHIGHALSELTAREIIPRGQAKNWRQRFRRASTMADLAPCRFVIESVTEDVAVKRRLFAELERIVSRRAIIASNTSSFPITLLQSGMKHPQRVIGMHWGEPAQIMRYLEIIPGRHTSPQTLHHTNQLGEHCGKEPTVLREDVRGFLSNRMMYAMIREACHLVDSGIADIATVDRSFRNDIGWWALLAGPFRWMDLTGIPAYEHVARGLLPKLSSSGRVPKLMRAAVARGAQGIANAKGYYPYTKKSARRWEKTWVDFTYDIRKLADKFAKRGV